jgi:hypothetical protein
MLAALKTAVRHKRRRAASVLARSGLQSPANLRKTRKTAGDCSKAAMRLTAYAFKRIFSSCPGMSSFTPSWQPS